MALPLLSVAAPALPGPALPGIGPHDARVAQDPAAWPWQALVLVQIPGASRCTGFLVAPRLVMAAAHCLYIRRAGHFAPAPAVHVLRGYDAGRYAAHALATSYEVLAGYDPRAASPALGADAALVVLDRAIAPSGGVLRLLPASGAARAGAGGGERAMLGGYNQDRAQVIEADPACRIVGVARDVAGHPLLRHDCAATRGTSGAPLLVRGADGWRVAGLQVAAAPARADGVAVPAATLAGLLEAAGLRLP